MELENGTAVVRANWWNQLVMRRRNWWILLLAVMIVGVGSMTYIGRLTYRDAPPIPDFISAEGVSILSQDSILRGQTVFLRYGLMNYGSMFGDGAGRGPDYTAEALHRVAVDMQSFYDRAGSAAPDGDAESRRAAIEARVKREIKTNTYDEATNSAVLTPAQIHAFESLASYYARLFAGEEKVSFDPVGYISDPEEIRDLAAFFYWGAWVCGAERPGSTGSYTHNWPYDETAGNLPTSKIVLWSVMGTFGFIFALGAILFIYGRYSQLGWRSSDRKPPIATLARVDSFRPTALQRSTYKFFATAMALFSVQIVAGILTVHDFLGLTRVFGVNLSEFIPITVTRSWHLQLALMWISACWVGASIFVLAIINDDQPKGQAALINFLYWLLVFLIVGDVVGIYFGPKGAFGEYWNLLGNQGWEFVEMGKLWQGLLFLAIALWCVIIYRAIRATWRVNDAWMLPKWLLYAVASILLLFISGFVAKPTTNFVIADFWRWAVIHMWVEAFFEVFATVMLAYFMYLMGLVSHNVATRIVYLSALLYLGSGLLGISHNFYWNAKPVETLAIGSVFSTLQVVPLILLTVEAWQFRRQPELLLAEAGGSAPAPAFGQSEAFLFLLAVNFWNFMGAGVFGFIINLPIVNYYEHGTYLTVNHGHAALMGVYGNLALGAIIFCCRYLIAANAWNAGLVRRAFWSFNIGLALMVLLDLFPAGIDQFMTVLERGFWYARSQDYILSAPFQTLTWARIAGGALFVLGGLLPLTWFIVSRLSSLRPAVQKTASVSPEPDLTSDRLIAGGLDA